MGQLVLQAPRPFDSTPKAAKSIGTSPDVDDILEGTKAVVSRTVGYLTNDPGLLWLWFIRGPSFRPRTSTIVLPPLARCPVAASFSTCTLLAALIATRGLTCLPLGASSGLLSFASSLSKNNLALMCSLGPPPRSSRCRRRIRIGKLVAAFTDLEQPLTAGRVLLPNIGRNAVSMRSHGLRGEELTAPQQQPTSPPVDT